MGQQQCDVGRALRRASRRLPHPRRGQDAVRARSLRRRRSSVAHSRARLHRIRLALTLHPQSPDPSAGGGAHELCPGADDRRSALVSSRPQAARGAKRDDHRLRLHAQDRTHRRHQLCGRDEKIGVHGPQLPAAGETGHADALLGQYGQGWRFRDLLRPLRHRQDDALRRSATHADRRRRAWVGAGRHLQFRGRLLRQGDQALARGGA